MCVENESTDDSAFALQHSKSKRSTLPGGASLAQKSNASSGELRRADAASQTRVAPGRAVAVCTAA